MLLKCTECGHDVSDKAEKCPNCGCPVSEIVKCLQNSEDDNSNDISDINSESEDSENTENSVFCKINGKRTNITWLRNIIEGLSETELYHYKYVWSHDMGSPKEQMKCLSKYSGTPEMDFYKAACRLYTKVCDKCNLAPCVTTARFLYEIVESNFELEEFYGESETEALEKIRRSLPPQVKCPYCGSYDTKKIFFRGGRAQKQWLCNNCRSKF